jgi:hypothetical protein
LGRGCSALQKQILVLALFNAGEPRREDNYPHRPDLYTREVMVTLYKIEANFISEAEAWDPSPYESLRTDLPVRDRRGWVFERKRGGCGPRDEGRVEVDPYNRAIVATVRAFARLEKRGFVKRRRRNVHAAAGIVLTPAGYQAALAHLKAIDPDRHQRVMSLLESRSNNGLMVKN